MSTTDQLLEMLDEEKRPLTSKAAETIRCLRGERDEALTMMRARITAAGEERRLGYFAYAQRVEEEIDHPTVEPVKPLDPPLVAVITRVVADRYGLTLQDLMADSRSQPAVTARQVAMRLIREMTDKSYPEIGRIFNRDHSTVIHACKAVEALAVEDIREEILARIESGSES